MKKKFLKEILLEEEQVNYILLKLAVLIEKKKTVKMLWI